MLLGSAASLAGYSTWVEVSLMICLDLVLFANGSVEMLCGEYNCKLGSQFLRLMVRTDESAQSTRNR